VEIPIKPRSIKQNKNETCLTQTDSQLPQTLAALKEHLAADPILASAIAKVSNQCNESKFSLATN
jgi:hypothetical protein